MTNEIYIPNELSSTLRRLSKEQKRSVVQTIDSLGDLVLENSSVVSTKGPAKGDLREAWAGDIRVLFRYTPENHSIIITDVASITPETSLLQPL